MKRIAVLLSVVVLTTGCGHTRTGQLEDQITAMRTVNGELVSQNSTLEYSLNKANADARSCHEQMTEAAKAEAAQAEAVATTPVTLVIEAAHHQAFESCLGQLKEGANTNSLKVTLTGNQMTCQFGP